ncbi:MAG TPA: hypothetical protein VJ843_00450 [Candidatus Saccharimonadales bacterium]|nr:hypothetical protein [Candidatus Saccharimonadales bacterium]
MGVNNGGKGHSRQTKEKAGGKSRKTYGGMSFINVNPTKSDAKQAKEAYENGELSLVAVWTWVEQGFDFACKAVPDGDGWKATFTDLREGSPTYNHQLRLDAGSPAAATLKALFFMEFRFETTWRPLDQGGTDAEEWF